MKAIVTTMVLAGLVAMANRAGAHCEVPCGIYTDEMRISMIREDCETIRKAMGQIETLSEAEPINYNQLVRWITTKDDHANKIQETVYQYFMNQRVSPVEPEKGSPAYDTYVHQITLLHGILVQAMTCKQTTDTAHVDQILAKLEAFEASYFEATGAAHMHAHQHSDAAGHTHDQ